MTSSFFRQQRQAWQQRIAMQHKAGWWQRLLAWLLMGVLLLVGLFAFTFFLFISWIIIPIWLWRWQKKVKTWQQTQHYHRQQHSPSQIIEGEVITKKEESR